jgi:hypothetical protein
MRNLIFIILLLLISVTNSFSQQIQNGLRLEAFIDNKPIEPKAIKLEICAKKAEIIPKLNDTGEFSTDILNWIEKSEEDILVKISFRSYELDFSNLTKDHLRGYWRVSVKNPPFSVSEDIPNPEKVQYIYQIEFNSGNSLGTVMHKIKYKN